MSNQALRQLQIVDWILIGALTASGATQTTSCQSGQAGCESGVPSTASASKSAGNASAVKRQVTILEFSEFDCFSCGRSSAVVQKVLEGRRDDVEVLFKHAPTTASSRLASEASLAAGGQGKFWEMHDLLFANQKQLTLKDLLKYASSLHLDMRAFQQALEQHTYGPAIDRDLAEARGLGVTISPTFFVNGRRLVGSQTGPALEAVIESIAATASREPREPLRVKQEDISTERAPTRGASSAPLTIVEFSDFECPFCQGEAGVIRDLLKAYPDRVRLVFKHFPLTIHLEAALAHQAALAAGEQGKFWEMHDLLFAEPQAIKRDDIFSKARQINLDMPRFEADLTSKKTKAAVQADRQEGLKLGVDSTPFFFVNGRPVSGSLPLREFKKVVEQELRRLRGQ